MSAGHDPAEAIGQVTHYFGHRSVAAVRLSVPLAMGDKIHFRGHTTDLVQNVASMEAVLPSRRPERTSHRSLLRSDE